MERSKEVPQDSDKLVYTTDSPYSGACDSK